MEAVVGSALEVIFERVFTAALQELAKIWVVEDNFDSLRDSLMRTKAILQAAEEQQITNQYVRLWLSNLKNAAYDAEDFLEFFFPHQSVIRSQAPSLKRLLEDPVGTSTAFFGAVTTGSNAEKIKKALHRLEKTIDTGLSTFKFSAPKIYEGGPPGTRESVSDVDYSKIYGRDHEKDRLVRLLLSSETSQDGYATCIPITGIGGIGKTTLAKFAYHDERVSQHFDSRMWIFVSEDFSVKKIMKAVIDRTGGESKWSEIEMLQCQLSKLLQKKRYLVVLDDVWTEYQGDWDKLRPLFTAGLNGSKIIVTTRSKKISLVINFPHSPEFVLNGLTDDDCWSLFKHRAFEREEDEVKYPNLTRIGKEIIKKVEGMPLAAESLGKSMRVKREEREWLFMRDSELWELDDQDKLFPALMLSLPSHLSQCFAFCSLFPKNYEFKKQKLIHLWMAEGFIPKKVSQRPEDIGEDYFSELFWISFLQEVRLHEDGEIIGYKMNDIIHALARYVAGKEYVALEPGQPQNRSLAEIRHASVVYRYGATITIPETLYEAKHLRTLLLIGNSGKLENGDKKFSTFQFLSVLDLNNCDLVDLPESLGGLKCLRYLDLSYTRISLLPSSIKHLFDL